MSREVHRVVAGMGTTPSLIIPKMATYHWEMRGSMIRTRSPLPTPKLRKTLANLLEATLSSQKVCFSAC